MKYDFTSILDRHDMDAMAVDLPKWFSPYEKGCVLKEGFDIIPMWVADMNFPTVPTIPAALAERAMHPAYGYFETKDEYYNSIIEWQAKRNHVTDLKQENIGYENGVLGGVVSALRVFCSQGDRVLVHTPTYIGFTGALMGNGFHIVQSPLVLDDNGIWRMDFDDMEEKIVKNKIHATIFCSPHNPTGRVWERWEIERAMELFRRHDVYVISDEIWSDLTLYGNQHIPTQSVSEDAKNRTVSLYAPSKTFNLAGLTGSYHIVYNNWLHDRIRKEASLCHYNSINVMSMHALIAAYGKAGEEWVDELRMVLGENVTFACSYIEKHFEGVDVSKPQGTYMLFLDCEKWCSAHDKTMDELLRAGYEAGVLWQDGRPFHGKFSIRMNLALPYQRVQEAFERLYRYVF